jgi:DNA repair protein RecN (Recombination protein N)
MLDTIAISHFTIIDRVEIDFRHGMTVLTGETGAGKSILLDAIKLVLGDRADSACVKQGHERADISVSFDISKLQLAQTWLQDNELDLDDGACLVRRVVPANGRSKAFINGSPATMAQLRELGELLVDLHGQHEHQSLQKPAVQMDLLDASIEQPGLMQDVASRFRQWRDAARRLADARDQSGERQQRIDLLELYCREFDELDLQPGEIRQLHQEYQRLNHAGQIVQTASELLETLYDAEPFNIQQQLSACQLQLAQLVEIDDSLQPLDDLINGALIQIQEVSSDLRAYHQSIDIDPARLEWVNQRIGQIQHLARRHLVDSSGDALLQHAQELRSELDKLDSLSNSVELLEQQLADARNAFVTRAQELSTQRRQAARTLSYEITAVMQTLGMQGGQFIIDIQPWTSDDKFRASGLDRVEFLVSTNPGQQAKPLTRVASGGELSRISLAIQVILSESAQIPTLIFDEVDSGIGGGIAEIVGRKLRNIAGQRQVLCVTHLPQVASQAHHHLQVSKTKGEDSTRTAVTQLDEAQRLEEIARMLGGLEITEQTRAHAREMLTIA